jgi:hypothetical protein
VISYIPLKMVISLVKCFVQKKTSYFPTPKLIYKICILPSIVFVCDLCVTSINQKRREFNQKQISFLWFFVWNFSNNQKNIF